MQQFRCLIIEDNPVNYMIMQNQLAKFGLPAVVCIDGQEGLDYCTSQPLPHLILLDGYMPNMDGITFLRKLRALPDGDRPYVLFCSSSMDKISVKDAMVAGADCHFPKPIKNEQMMEVITAVKKRFPDPTIYTQAL